MKYNVLIPVVAIVEAESKDEAIQRLSKIILGLENQSRGIAGVCVYSDEILEPNAFESEPL